MKYALLALLLVAFNASATNPPNDCGNHGNNCQPGDPSGNSSSSSSSNAGAVGVGVGLGLGGDGGNGGAGGHGGSGGAGGVGYGGSAIGLGGAGGDSSSAVKDSGNSHNLNANNAQGGDAKAYGGSSGAISGSKSVAQMASENSATLKNAVNASSNNANNSQASGNTTVTNVGGDSTLVERNAPPVFLGAITPTSCGGSFNAGGSSRDGAGGFGFSWVGTECAIRLMGDRYQQLGQVDIACELYSSTKAFKKSAKRNPKLASIDCKAKPAPAAAPVLVAPELAPRIPRG